MGGQPGSGGEVSKRVKIVIVIMLLILVVPAAVIALPLSKIEVTLTNSEDDYSVNVLESVSGVDNGYFSSYIGPQGRETFSCYAHSGSHSIRIQYTYPDDQYYYQYYYQRTIYDTVTV